jgi:hypothetical protein
MQSSTSIEALRANEAGSTQKPFPGAENPAQIPDFSSGGAARQSAQKRSARERIDSSTSMAWRKTNKGSRQL